MKHPYEYRTLLHFMPYLVISGEPDFKSEETQRQIMQVVNNFMQGLPGFISEGMSDSEDWEVNSHSITFAPDGTIVLSILLQRHRT